MIFKRQNTLGKQIKEKGKIEEYIKIKNNEQKAEYKANRLKTEKNRGEN